MNVLSSKSAAHFKTQIEDSSAGDRLGDQEKDGQLNLPVFE